MQGVRLLYTVLVSILLLSACSRNEPLINGVQLRLIYHENSENKEAANFERLSLMIAAGDEDGIADLAALYLVHDRDQLYWTLHDTDWIHVERSGRIWIGSHNISMVNDEPFPRGAYRILLEDKGGERTERIISFDAPEKAEFAFPSFTLSEGNYRLNSSYPSNTLVLYDSQGAMIRTVRLETKTGTLRSLDLPRAAQGASLFSEDPDTMVCAFTGMIPLQ